MDSSSLLDGLLDQNLNTIADLPTYAVPPNGFYKLLVKKVEKKKITTKNGEEEILDIQYVVKEALELSDPAAEEARPAAEKVKEGQEFNESFFFRNKPEMTLSALKTNFADVAATFNCQTLRETLDKLEGLEIAAQLKQRVDKESDRVFAQLRNIKVL